MQTNKYWEQRFAEIFNNLDKSDDVIAREMLNEYRKAAEAIGGKIDAFYERYADKHGISYFEAQKRIRKTDMTDYVERANQYRQLKKDNPELLKRLNAQLTNSKITRLELLKYELEFEVYKATVNQEEKFTTYLQNQSAYVYSALAVGNAIRTLNPLEVQTILSMEWSGANYSQRIWRNTDRLAERLKDEMVNAAIRGQNPRVTARALRDLAFTNQRKVTERLVRTETTYVANATTAKRYEKDGVEKYEFLATLDSRTSEICRELNGKVFNMSDFQPGQNAPAMHPHCRSTIIPANDELSKYDKYLEDRKPN